MIEEKFLKKNPVISIILILLIYFLEISKSQDIIFPGNVRNTTKTADVSSPIEGTRNASPNTGKRDQKCVTLCIPLDFCPSLFELLESPDHWKLKLLQERSCGFTKSGDPLVRCDEAICNDRSHRQRQHKETEKNVTSSSAQKFQANKNDTVQISTRIIPSIVNDSPIPVGISDNLCGTTLLSRIHGGENAAREEFPWLIALAIETLNGPQIICGGALISEEWVITAAHCVVDSLHRLRNISHIRVGAYDISKAHEDGAENIKVKSIFYHPQFSERPVIKNDIALLKLQKSISYSVTVGTICLPEGTSPFPSLVDANVNTKATVAGWGGNGQKPSFNILQKVEIPLIPSSSCVKSLLPLRVRVIPELQICGGAKNLDSCKGDSGGPLMVTVNGRATLVGIISYGTIQCDGRLPGVYTRVTSYLSWVTETILHNTK